jgi:hypothetical protein
MNIFQIFAVGSLTNLAKMVKSSIQNIDDKSPKMIYSQICLKVETWSLKTGGRFIQVKLL